MPVRARSLVFLGLSLLVAGCGKPADDIRAYTVPREKEAAKKPAPESGDKYRMLAAVIPADGKFFWFVKFVGPVEVVSPLVADFDSFVKSIKAGNDSNVPPTYTIPDGWKSVPVTGMQSRIVSLRKGDAQMYLSNPFSGSLLENVNRWRKEVGLRDVTEAELKDVTTEIKLGDKTAYTVDLRGPTWSGGMPGMNAPFAGKR